MPEAVMDCRINYNPETKGVEFYLADGSMMVAFVMHLEDAATMSSKLAGIVLDHPEVKNA